MDARLNNVESKNVLSRAWAFDSNDENALRAAQADVDCNLLVLFVCLTSLQSLCILIHDRGVEPARKMADFVTQMKRHSTIGLALLQ